jgi:hypothetical protein
MDCNGVQGVVVANSDEEGRLPWEPSKEQILAACEEIRKSWTPHRLATRAGFVAWRLQSAHCPFTSDTQPLRIE